MFVDKLREMVARNLRKPESTYFGKFLASRLIKQNSFLEVNAVKFCDIQPDDVVLEVGFGPGVGLEEACKYITKGQGIIHGGDFSPEMVKTAQKRLHQQIQDGLVVITEANVENLPYNDNMFDKVFHVNCFYFWPDIHKGCRELFRVMKPGSVMVTAMNPNAIRKSTGRGFMRYGNTDHIYYMEALKTVGFTKVNSQELREESNSKNYRIISAQIEEKNH